MTFQRADYGARAETAGTEDGFGTVCGNLTNALDRFEHRQVERTVDVAVPPLDRLPDVHDRGAASPVPPFRGGPNGEPRHPPHRHGPAFPLAHTPLAHPAPPAR